MKIHSRAEDGFIVVRLSMPDGRGAEIRRELPDVALPVLCDLFEQVGVLADMLSDGWGGAGGAPSRVTIELGHDFNLLSDADRRELIRAALAEKGIR